VQHSTLQAISAHHLTGLPESAVSNALGLRGNTFVISGTITCGLGRRRRDLVGEEDGGGSRSAHADMGSSNDPTADWRRTLERTQPGMRDRGRTVVGLCVGKLHRRLALDRGHVSDRRFVAQGGRSEQIGCVLGINGRAGRDAVDTFDITGHRRETHRAVAHLVGAGALQGQAQRDRGASIESEGDGGVGIARGRKDACSMTIILARPPFWSIIHI